jgi:hypothetical protein
MTLQVLAQLLQLGPAPFLCTLNTFLLCLFSGLSAFTSAAATLGLCLLCWALLRFCLLPLLPTKWDGFFELVLPQVPLGYVSLGMGLLAPVLEVLCLQAAGCAAVLCAAVGSLQALAWLASQTA